jgi:6-phosphogluconolactonase/glucosamine-6-phosphate isomerase/deaminase
MYTDPKFQKFLEEVEEDTYELTEEGAIRDVEHVGEMIQSWGLERVLNAFKFALVATGDPKGEAAAKAIAELAKHKPESLREKILEFIANL